VGVVYNSATDFDDTDNETDGWDAARIHVIALTPTPTITPAITPTRTPTSPPTSTPTSVIDHIEIDITTNQDIYHAGDSFLLTTVSVNPGPAVQLNEYIILDIVGQYWYWDNWTPSVDFRLTALPASDSVEETILNFTWPVTSSSFYGIYFWAAFLDPETYELVGDYGYCDFGFDS
jgi:hypothetical protein